MYNNFTSSFTRSFNNISDFEHKHETEEDRKKSRSSSRLSREFGILELDENIGITPLVRSPRGDKTQRKESLLTTTTSAYTKEVFKQASELLKIIETAPTKIKNLSDRNQKLYLASKDLINKINLLFEANREPSFPIIEKKSKPAKDKKNIEETAHSIWHFCNNIINLCYEKSPAEHQHKILKEIWHTKELDHLRENSKNLIDNLNTFLCGALPYIKLSEKNKVEKLAHKIKEKIYPSQLNCTFQDQEEQRHWNKVKDKVEHYFKTHILMELNQSDFIKEQIRILDVDPINDLLGKRLLLEKRKKEGEETKEYQKDLERNEIHILGAYHTKLLKFAEDLKTTQDNIVDSTHRNHVAELKQIFQNCLKNKYTENLGSAFLLNISHSLITHYIENSLEPLIVTKIEAMLTKWKQDGNRDPLDYATLEESHWKRLLTSTTMNMEETKRALLGGKIWVVNEKNALLLGPLEKAQSIEKQTEEETARINRYLCEAEILISRHIGDPQGTLLTNFRLIGYGLLQKQKPEASQIKEEENLILNKIEKFDGDLAILRNKLKNGLELDERSKSIMQLIEKILKEPPLAELNLKLSLKDICIHLSIFYREVRPDDNLINEFIFNSGELPFLQIFRSKIQESLEAEIAKEKKNEEPILSMNEKIFTAFAPVMKQIENGEPLSSQQQNLLDHVETLLKTSNEEAIQKHGLIKIARLLFSFHRILNQSFTIGTLTTLISVLKYIYPKEPNKKELNKITSLEDSADSTFVYVELGKDSTIALEWEITQSLYSDNWLLTQKLRIELPPMGSDHRGNLTQEFQCKRKCLNDSPRGSEKEKSPDKKLKENNRVFEIIFNIRRVLKAMKFPEGSFNQEVVDL